MKTRRLSPLCFLFLCLLAPSLAKPAQSQILIIANPKLSAPEVSTADLRDIFTGAATSFKNIPRLLPILLRDGPAHQQMLDLYIGKSDSAFRATWRSLVFSGQGVMPRSTDTEAAVVDFVAHTPGAIGYIEKSTPHDGVKVLAVR